MLHAATETAGNFPAEAPGTDARLGSEAPPWLREGELFFQRCRWCRTASFRLLLCPVCGSNDLVWERSDGIGHIRRVRVVYRRKRPQRVYALIRMAEGFHVRSAVAGGTPWIPYVGAQAQLASDATDPSGDLVFELCAAASSDRQGP